MKLRRRHLEQRYQKQIDMLYAEDRVHSRGEQHIEHSRK